MPRLREVPERHKFDLYDCLTFQPGEVVPQHKLFGPSYIGNRLFTNMDIPNMNGADVTMVVTNWRARTNVPAGALRDAIGSLLVADLWIGRWTVRMRTSCIGDLLAKAPDATLDEAQDETRRQDERLAMVDRLALAMFDAHGHTRQLGEVEREWNDLSNIEQSRWRASADAAYRVMSPSPYVIIPVRQTFGVTVNVFQPDVIADLLEDLRTLPADRRPATDPRVWIHLEGWETRDVC